MQGFWQRASLAAALGLGVVAGLIRAEEPSTPPTSSVTIPVTIQVSVPNQAVAVPNQAIAVSGPVESAAEPYVTEKTCRKRPLRDWVHNNCACCWTTINRMGCGSFHSECTFIFGSCREFYGEPCLTGPPPSLLPPGYAPPQGGCNCR